MFDQVNIQPITFISAMSMALEMTTNGIAGHHRRTALIARCIGRQIGLSRQDEQVLVYSALLHDIGAASDWYEKHYIVHADGYENGMIYHHAECGYALLKDSPQLAPFAIPIRHHHDRFEGGNPSGLSGQDIPLSSCIIHLADRIEVQIRNDRHIFLQRNRIRKGIRAISHLFDPELVAAFEEISQREVFWLDIVNRNIDRRLMSELAIWDKLTFHLDDLIHIANVFARIVDMTSHYTHSHSRNVANVAQELALIRGFSEDEALMFRLTGLMHDIGKLAVPNAYLNKRGKLNRTEYEIIKQHPYYGQQILERVEGFEHIALWVGTHHETLDGKGYPYRLNAHEIELGTRVLAVSDILCALVEDRPYRSGMEAEQAMGIMRFMAESNKIDSTLVADVENNLHRLLPLIDGHSTALSGLDEDAFESVTREKRMQNDSNARRKT